MKNNSTSMKRLKELANLEFKSILKEAAEKEAAEPKIATELEKLRQKLMKTMTKYEDMGDTEWKNPRAEKRIQVNMVADIIGVPVNELVLYFLNNVKNVNGRFNIEYRLGSVTFYAD